MFKRILLPTSGSPITEKKAETILHLIGDPKDAEITILYVIKSYPNFGVVSSELEQKGIDTSQICLEDAKNVVKKATKVFKENGIPYTLKVEIGEPVETIIKVATETNSQLMIVGHHGESTLSDYLFKGNITAQLINKSPCPILVVK